MKLIRRIVRSIRPVRKKKPSATNFSGSISVEDEAGVRRAIELASDLPGPIVEIGALFGHTTNFMASVADPAKKIIAVDNFKWNPLGLSPEAHKRFVTRTLRYILDHRDTELHTNDSISFLSNYTGPTPSMIFIDADHSYEAVKADIAAAVKLGIPVISGHDFSDQHKGVQRAVREAFNDNVEVHGTVWVSRKR